MNNGKSERAILFLRSYRSPDGLGLAPPTGGESRRDEMQARFCRWSKNNAGSQK